MQKYLKAECVFLILCENHVLDCEGAWKRERQQIMYDVPCFLSKNSLTAIRFLTVYIKNNEYFITFNSVESLLNFIPAHQKKFVIKTLNDCVAD